MSQEFNIFEQEQKTSIENDLLTKMLDRTRERQEKKNEEGQRRIDAKRIIEALLFASKHPLSFNQIREVCDTTHPLKPKTLRSIIEELQHEYISHNRAFRLEEMSDGLILKTCEEFGHYLDILHREKRGEKLSSAATEVLAIIAYRQPITRPQIEAIRGVDSSGTVMGLFERGLIEEAGKLETPGRPTLFTTTNAFLQYYGLNDIKDLPPVEKQI